mmetsp:Transcript_24738/g.79900  ORF Transcript_24738/g.79900 Transcript_24738/m.79900 type:complete len:149 (-) Transcript_24738:985-1431(-)
MLGPTTTATPPLPPPKMELGLQWWPTHTSLLYSLDELSLPALPVPQISPARARHSNRGASPSVQKIHRPPQPVKLGNNLPPAGLHLSFPMNDMAVDVVSDAFVDAKIVQADGGPNEWCQPVKAHSQGPPKHPPSSYKNTEGAFNGHAF